MTRRLAALVMAIAALLHWSSPAYAVNGVVRGQLISDTRQFLPPASSLSGVGVSNSKRWGSAIGQAFRASYTKELLYDTMKNGGQIIKIGGISVAKTAVKGFGVNVAATVAGGLIIKAMEATFNRMVSDVSGQDALFNCLNQSNTKGQSFNPDTMTCSVVGKSGTMTFPQGPLPAQGSDVYWWNTPNPYGPGAYYFRVFGNRMANGQTSYDIAFSCPGRISDYVFGQDPYYWHNYYVNRCQPPQVTVERDVPFYEWVDGSSDVPPHPAVKQALHENMARYFEENPPSSNTAAPFWPGFSLDGNITHNQFYGDPCADVREDLDGDTWSDCEEVSRDSNPEDPASVPNPARDTDGDQATDGDEDRLRTNPYDSGSTPDKEKYTDTDKDGIVDFDDPDDDNDQVPDTVEIAAGSNPKDATSKPPDTDGDGQYDYTDPDDDNDNVPDEIDPEPLNPKVPQNCGPGTVASQDGKSCVPKEDPANCPEGQKSDGMTPPKCVPDTDPKDPTGDKCGDFRIPRLLAHTGHYLRDVIVPCEPLADIFKPLLDLAKTKFPFALTSSLGTVVTGPAAGDQGATLPAKLGPFDLDWSWIAPLVLVVGLLFKGFISWVAIDILLSKMMGQLVIK